MVAITIHTKMYQLVMLLITIQSCSAVIYSLNETEYYKMPRLYDLDEYSACLQEPAAAYCVADFELFTEEDSALMDMIQQYSDHKMKHFNHTQIHRGVCVTRTCADFIQNLNDTADPSGVLEACLNHTIWKDYRIQVRLKEIRYCKRAGDTIDIDTYDVIVAVVYVILILLNVIGSCYDIMFCKGREKSGNPYLLAFSISRNWDRMVASPKKGSEPRLERLKLFHGMRTMTMFCVFFSHTVLMMAFSYVNNPLYIEKAYEDPMKQILFNGSLVTHTFFVMSSFLMAFNLQLHAEKHQLGWHHWPKGVLTRWLRLTPTYALVLATISTWMRHLGSGPLWELVVGSEAAACRRYWWAHLLYVNNYVYDDALCAPQTWYLAADTQLFCFGLLLCIAAQSKRARTAALTLTFLASLVITALHTYLQDLEAVVIQSPE
ncbi:nose resistant to fluoxetine protein 6-like [Ostrinia furnacalis]|nr:nose resistant to fluoxetine protein 6-like [Ostrinia furnacalis]